MHLLQIFKQSLFSQKKPSSPITAKNYISDIRHFISWFESNFGNEFSPSTVTSETIELYKKSNLGKLSGRSLERHLSSLRKFFIFLAEKEFIKNNPLAKTLPEKTSDIWRIKEFKDLLYLDNASAHTIKNYIKDIEGLRSWYAQTLGREEAATPNSFDLQIIEEYKRRLLYVMGLSPKTINRKLSAIRKYIEFASAQNNTGIIENIDTQAPQEKVEEEPSSLTDSNIEKKLSLFNIEEVIAARIVRGIRYLQSKSSSKIKRIANIKKEFYAPESMAISSFPLHRKLYHHIRYTRPDWYKRYHNQSFAHYLNASLLIIYSAIIGLMLYQNLFEDKRASFAAPTTPLKVYSFQGRLTDASDNPITTGKLVRFILYSDVTASASARLWEEVRPIGPDEDGIFSVLLGSNASGGNATACTGSPSTTPATGACGLPDSLFRDNTQVFLGISIENDSELVPRQQVATVAYATNSQYLQGLAPITQSGAGTTNVILALDSSGNLTIGDSASPTFQASGGQLTLSGNTLILKTNSGSNGDVQLIPDGIGRIDLRSPLVNLGTNGNISPGAVEINDKFAIQATESAVAAFIVNNNTSGGDIFTASSSGTTRFTIGNDGTVTVGGSIVPKTTGSVDLGSSSLRWNNIYVNTVNTTATNTSGQAVFTYDPATTAFSESSVLVNPTTASTNDTLLGIGVAGVEKAGIDAEGDLVVGYSSATAPLVSDPFNVYNHGTTRVAFIDTSGNGYFAGNVGIGTTGPAAQLDQYAATPEHRLTSSGDSNNTRITRSSTANTATRYNSVNTIATTYSINFVDASSQHITVNSSASLNFTPTNFTLSAWVRRNAAGVDEAIYDSGTQTNPWVWLIGNDNKLNVSKLGVSDNRSTGTIADTNWHHVAFVKSGDSGVNGTHYIDGVAAGTNSISTVSTPSGGKKIAREDSFNVQLDGKLDDFRIYSRALSPAEIVTLAAGGDPATTNLEAHWKFNEGTGTSAADASGNSNTGTLVNTPTWSTDIPSANPGGSATLTEIAVWSSKDGGVAGEQGIQTLGWKSGRTVIEGSDIRFDYGSSQTEAMRIDGTGRLGIGTTSPLATLDVRGNSGIIPVASVSGQTSFAALVVDNRGVGDIFAASSSGLNRFVIKQNGNVGIGTTTPNNLIQVANLINFDNTNLDTSLGFQAGAALTTGGLSNTAVGYQALNSATTADNNTAIGYQALKVSTVSNQTAVGYLALAANTSGTGNNAFGSEALASNLIGNFNSAFGREALYSNTASDNSAFGYQALQDNVSGTLNNAFGGFALANSTGSNNSAFGRSALFALITGGGNTAIGTAALNTIVGGDNNTALGYRAGLSSSGTFSNNILIGYQAGDALSTGSNNIVIGYDIDAPSASGNNQLSIGNLIFGTGIDGTGTSISTGKIGIGTTTPTALLDVAGTASVSGALKLYGTPTIQSTANQTLTLGGNTTGDISFSPGNSTNAVYFKTGGNVGIGTTNPIKNLSVISASALGTAFQLGNNDIGGKSFYFTSTGSGNGEGVGKLLILDDVAVRMTFSGANVGIGTTSPTAMLHVLSTLGTSPAASISGRTAGPALLVTNDGVGDLFAASASGSINFRVKNNGDLVVGNGAGKITNGTFDPLYTIDGGKYSTFAPSMIGVKEEYAGKANLSYDTAAGGYAYTLDFNNFEISSDFWVFSRVIDPNIDSITVLMTPNSQAKTWYRKDPVARKLTFYSDRPTEISFRLTAPRFDYAKWGTISDELETLGLVPPPAPPVIGSGTPDGQDNFFSNVNIQLHGGVFELVDNFGNVIIRTEAFSAAKIAQLTAGIITATQLTIDNLQLTSENFTIAGQSFGDYITNRVQTILNTSYLLPNTNIVSPLASIDQIYTNILSPLASETITVKGNVKVEKQLTSDNLQVTNNATVSGSLVANNVQTNTATISGNLAANTIQTSALTTTDVYTDGLIAGSATVSGTLRAGRILADDIVGLQAHIATLAANTITNNTYVYQSTPSADFFTSIPPGQLDLGFIDISTFSASFGTFRDGLIALGPSTFNQITAMDSISVGTNLMITNNSINLLAEDLQIQPFRQGGVSFLAGLVRIDTQGNLVVGGNAEFEKNVTVRGKLATNIISPLPNQDINVALENNGVISEFKIKGASTSAVLAINSTGDLISSGSGTFNKLNLSFAQPAYAIDNTTAIATGSAGTAILKAPKKEITINNPLITESSLIYITPVGTATNQVLYLLRQVANTTFVTGSFTVGIAAPTLQDIQFNWIIVN